MQTQKVPVYAAIDIGSNTIHIVVARSAPHSLEILADEQELVRIGKSVTSTGEISAQKRDASIATLHKYREIADHHHAEAILVVATEAIRQATNGAAFLNDLRAASGLEIFLIDGPVEATLTFYGATYEVMGKADEPALLGVMDLGGGSTELVVAKQEHIAWHISLPIGSGWLHDRYLSTDPPSYDDLAVAHTFLSTYLQGIRVKPHPALLLATGGSANTLFYLARDAFHIHAQQPAIAYDDLLRCQGLLYTLSAEEIAQRYRVPIERARILPAGALIIQAVMDRLEVKTMHVSTHGIREGCLLAYARYGQQWLQKVQQEAQAVDALKNSADSAPATSFIQTGRHLLQERLSQMLEWRSEVLRQQDIEAVHKMRVASRRLRAVLDAYQPLCDARLFNKVYRQVKDLADALGKARDMDVMIARLSEQQTSAGQEEQAGFAWLIDRLQVYRQRYQHQLAAFLHHLDDDTLRKQMRLCLPRDSAHPGKH